MDKQYDIEELLLLKTCKEDGILLEKSLTHDEAKIVSRLVSMGALFQGTTDGRKRTVCYFPL